MPKENIKEKFRDVLLHPFSLIFGVISLIQFLLGTFDPVFNLLASTSGTWYPIFTVVASELAPRLDWIPFSSGELMIFGSGLFVIVMVERFGDRVVAWFNKKILKND